MRNGSWPFTIFCTRSGTTWLIASFTLPLSTSASPRARISPTPTQLNGLTMVYGRSCCWCAARAKYSTASFWNPYDDPGGGISSCWPSYDGHDDADSNTIDELMN